MNNRLKIRITGKTKKYLLNEIIRNKINIYDLKEKDDKYEIIIDLVDYDRLLQIKTTNKVQIIERIGLNKYLFLIKKNIFTILFIILGILLNILLSNLVLDIEVIHSSQEIRNIIEKDLYDYGLRKYKLKVSYEKKEQIKNKILEKEKDKIDWIEIEEHGTKYKIKVEDRKKKKLESCSPRNIVSNKNAIITKITSESGEILKKINDYVTPGEILISGIIHNKEKAVDKKCSIGTVYGETWYKVKVNLNNTYETTKETNNKKNGIKIKFFNYEYNLFNKFSKYKINEYNIIESKILPIKIGLASFQEIKKITKKNTISNIDKKVLELVENKIKERLSKDESILTKKVLKKTVKNSKIEVEVFVSTEENITAYQDITNVNIEELNRE